MDGRSILSAAQSLLLEDPGKKSQHKFTKLTNRLRIGRETSRGHRQQEGFVLDSVVGVVPIPCHPPAWSPALWPGAGPSGLFHLPCSKGREAASVQKPWPEGELVAQTRGNRILRSCVYPRSWLQQPSRAMHMENMQAGKCLLAWAPFMLWTIIFCISTSWKYQKEHSASNEDLLVCSEGLWAVM